MPSRLSITYLLTMLLYGSITNAAVDTFRIHADYPYLDKDERLLLNVFYTADSSFTGELKILFYKFNTDMDSLRILYRDNKKFLFKKGIHKVRINFSKNDSNTSYNSTIYEILKVNDDLPPGKYKVQIVVKDAHHVYENIYLHYIDTPLSTSSKIRNQINKTLLPKQKSFMGLKTPNTSSKKKSVSAATSLSNSKHKVEKVAKKNGLTTKVQEFPDKRSVDFYYANYLVGRYDAYKNKSISDQADDDEKNASSDNSVQTENMDHPSIYSQYQKRNKEDKEETKGEVGLATNTSSEQEPNSGVDNNYYELKGRLEMPVAGIPIETEGYFTSQDNHREVKASYFRVHYDVDKMKDKLGKSMNSYNSKYSDAKSKGSGMDKIYGSAITNLEQQKAAIQNEVAGGSSNSNSEHRSNLKLADAKNAKNNLPKKTSSAGDSDPFEEEEPDDSTSMKNDSLALVKKEKREKKIKKAEEDQKKAEAKRKQVEELDRKIEKYKVLQDQNRNTQYFDSTLAYSKTHAQGNTSDMSYKQMAKSGANLLPDGKAKSFIAGVTTADAGTFSKSESKYTMGGQNVKGLDFGYDLGFCEAGGTVGKTEYVGRDGTLDKYTCYSGNILYRPVKSQKIKLLYYGYSPDKKLSTNNDFFKNQNISTPAFFQPVHIFSLGYTGTITKYVNIDAEAATSVKQSDKYNNPAPASQDKMAYHFSVEGNIPNTAISLEGAYDKTGKNFENNTLPVLLAGTEQYRLAGRNDFFHSFLSVGVEYNRLMQNNFSSKGSNTKWGFDLRTNSKRYPNVAVSYKPFATFRYLTDTLNIPQKPMFGSVATGKLTYQLRRHQRSYRFSALYNKCVTTMDTAKYGTKLMQGSVTYANKSMTTTVTAGSSEVVGTNISSVMITAPAKMSFLSLNCSYAFSKAFAVTTGYDFGRAYFGFCKYSMIYGIMYRFKKPDMILRANVRYSTFKLTEIDPWKNLYSGAIDLTYKFKTKNGRK